MRPRSLGAAALLVVASVAGSLVPPSARAEGPAAATAGKAYGPDEIAALVEGLGYEGRPLDRGGRGFLVARPGYTIEINLVVSTDGSKLNVFSPLRAWKDLGAVPEEALLGLLRATGEYGPTRAYVLPTAQGVPWVGLVRSLDNRDLHPSNVREQIDFLFERSPPHGGPLEPRALGRRRAPPRSPSPPAMDAGR